MKVSIIGLGRVGSTLAHTLVLKELVSELVLVGRRFDQALGDALDLHHAQLFVDNPIHIRAGEVADTAGSEVVAICASRPWKDGFMDRLQAAADNTRLFEEILPRVAAAAPEAKLLIVTNPVDVLTYHAIRITGFPPSRVLGTGTLVDSARFRALLSDEVQIHPADLRAYVLGEHGDSQFAAFSCAEAGGEQIEAGEKRRRLFEVAKEAGLDVFRKKGFTNYAIATAAAYIIRCIALDTHHTVPVSLLIDGYLGVSNVCLSLPAVLGRAGITRVLHPPLDDDEAEAFRRSAAVVRQAIERSMPGVQPPAA